MKPASLFRSSTKEDPLLMEINTTPLIDVMLVLLILLIVTIPIQNHSATLALPGQATHADPPPHYRTIEVEIDAHDQIRWQGLPVADAHELEKRCMEALSSSQPVDIHLHPMPGATYAPVAEVLSTAQRLGITRIGLVK